MKKFLTALLISSCIYSISSAQTKSTAEFGANIGFNATTVSYGGTAQSSDYGAGFNAGVSLEYYISDEWGVKVKMTYDQKGWGNGFLILKDESQIDDVNFHLNYLTIPVMANWHFGRTRNWYVNLGPYIGVLLNANESSNSDTGLKDYFNTTDFGLALGIGVKFPVSNSVKMFIEADGQSGFTNIFKESDGTIQNMRSSINVGFLVPIK